MYKIATITATYNRQNRITRCLDSIWNQSRRPDHMIVIDDASTDDTDLVVNKWGEDTIGETKKDSNFPNIWTIGPLVYCKLETNGGPSKARNEGLSIAKGVGANLIQIADSDDILLEDKIKLGEEVMQLHPQIGLVYSDYIVVQDNKEKINLCHTYSRQILEHECIISNNSMIRMEIIEKVGAYDCQLGGAEDWDLWLRITEMCLAYRIPKFLYKYYLDGDNITLTTDPQQFNKWRQIVAWKLKNRTNSGTR